MRVGDSLLRPVYRLLISISESLNPGMRISDPLLRSLSCQHPGNTGDTGEMMIVVLGDKIHTVDKPHRLLEAGMNGNAPDDMFVELL